MRTNAAYEERLVLFLDILGFREIIADTRSNPEILKRILGAIDEIGEFRQPNVHESKRVSQFSDSIVVSFAISEESAVFWLVNDLALTIINLVDAGFLVRGGVTVGDLIHTGHYLVGPALVRAYEMESRLAVNPRVIFDPILLTAARKYHAKHHTPDEEEQFVLGLLATDVDGQLYFNYASWHYVVNKAGADHRLYVRYLSRLGEMAAARMQHGDVAVVRKGLWLWEHYNRALDELCEGWTEEAIQADTDGFRDSVQALPRHADLARRARARVPHPLLSRLLRAVSVLSGTRYALRDRRSHKDSPRRTNI